MTIGRNIVYWTSCFDFFGYCSSIAPQSILKKVKQFNVSHENSFLVNFLKCPVFNSFSRKTFNLISPIDYSIMVNDNGVTTLHNDQSSFEQIINVRDFSLSLFSINIAKYIFFTEEKCKMTWSNSFFSEGEFSPNVDVIPGEFLVSDWFRVTDLAFHLKTKNNLINIKRGEPLCSVSFDFFNGNNIQFKKFSCTEEIMKLSNFNEIGKFVSKPKINFIMEKYYQIFNQSSVKKHIIKEIKKNLVE